MQILRDVYKDGSWSAPDMILELADEEQNRDENQEKSSFSDTQQVRTGRCNLLFLWGQLRCWGNIVML